jgi:predicted secreted protein
MANIVNGSDVCLFVTSGSTSQVIAMSTGCKISITMGTIKTSSKDSGRFESSVAGRFSYTVDGDAFYSLDADAGRYTYDELMTMYLARTPLTISIGSTTGVMPQVLGTGKVLTGSVLITKLDMDAKDDAAVTFTISMEGVGALTYV